MSRHDNPSGYYYYASGEPVRLTLDEDWLAVDAQRLEAVDSQGVLRDACRPLRKDLVLVRRSDLSEPQHDALAKQGAVHPVFHAEGARLVALPEVRVEDSSPARQKAVQQWLRQHGDEAEVVEDRGDRLVLRPTSGRGLDALALANHLTEQVGPEMAQPRFLRIVDRADT